MYINIYIHIKAFIFPVEDLSGLLLLTGEKQASGEFN